MTFTNKLRPLTDNIYVTKNKYTMSNKVFFKIYYCSTLKMYDFTILNSITKEVIYHYHFTSLGEINKLIQKYK